MDNLDSIRDSNGELPAYAWPGGSAVLYICADGGTLCAACANGGNGSRAAERLDSACPDDDQWRVVGYQTTEGEEEEVRCDHCNTIIHFGETPNKRGYRPDLPTFGFTDKELVKLEPADLKYFDQHPLDLAPCGHYNHTACKVMTPRGLEKAKSMLPKLRVFDHA